MMPLNDTLKDESRYFKKKLALFIFNFCIHISIIYKINNLILFTKIKKKIRWQRFEKYFSAFYNFNYTERYDIKKLSVLSRSVMVSTWDFESRDRGSIPLGRIIFSIFHK